MTATASHARAASSDAPFDPFARHDLIPLPVGQVRAALELIDATTVADQTGRWRSIDRASHRKGGRPALISDRAVLTVYLILALAHQPLHATRVAEVIAHRLTPETRKMLGITTNSGTEQQWYTRAWRAIHRVFDVIDPYPARRNRILTKEEIAATLAARDPRLQAERELRLNWFGNQIVDASWALLDPEIRRRWKGNVCIDATPVPTFARPSTERSPSTLEPDAAWYVRQGDHRDRGDAKGRKKGKALFGWETHIVVATTNDPAIPANFPLIATGMSFERPGCQIAENTTGIFASMRDRGMPIGVATGDRAYWSNSEVTKLQLPVRAMGWRNVNDYKETELGIQAWPRRRNHGRRQLVLPLHAQATHHRHHRLSRRQADLADGVA